MTNEQFDALVHKLEADAQRNPGLYPVKVFLLAGLGNFYVGAMLLFCFGLLAGALASLATLKAFAVKIVIVVGAFLWMILRALWVKLEAPEGTEVRRGDAPELFALIDELRGRLRAPRFHRVLVTDAFNAGVVQIPRLGIFGWPRNYLLIGLPLMKAFTIEQFKAVLAHEFGHLAKGHGRASNWIYRQRLRWSRLLAVLDASESKGGFLFRPFLHWFAPYFNAYSFPLARANEYEADATSVRLTSPQAAAQALTSVHVLGSYLAEHYWPKIHRQADSQPQPQYAPYASMTPAIAADLDEVPAHSWLERALTHETTSADTHPALRDRLNAIGAAPQLVLPQAGAAADRLLGGALEPITQAFDRRWQEQVEPAWEQRYREVQEERRELAELNDRAAGGEELGVREVYRRATLTHSAGHDPDAALAQLRALHQLAPDDALVCFGLGSHLLQRDDGAGCPLLERAMQLDEEATAASCQALRDYFWRKGEQAQAHVWHERLAMRHELEAAAHHERNEVRLSDTFDAHDVAQGDLAKLTAQLHSILHLRKAYLVKKRVAHFPQRVLYVLGYSVSRPLRLHSQARVEEALRAIQETVVCPAQTIIINVDKDNAAFARKLNKVQGSRIL